ncbi:nucleoside permease nupG, partial [Escherichia coli EC1856]
ITQRKTGRQKATRFFYSYFNT